MKRKVLGSTHPDVGVTLNNLRTLSLKDGNKKGSGQIFQESNFYAVAVARKRPSRNAGGAA